MGRAVSVLNGSPFFMGNTFIYNEEELWNLLYEEHAAGNIITAASQINCGNDSHRTEDGIACSHAYSVLGVIQLSDENGTQLVKMRNPWGEVSYHGDWSYHSPLWTDDLREFVKDNGPGNDTNEHDGIFYIDIESFRTNYEEFNINFDTYNWK